MKKIIILLFFILLLLGCAKNPDTPYIKSIKEFHSKRIERLKQPNSWLTLVGLYWLKEGKNSFGTDKLNDFVFPEGTASEFIGSFFLKDTVVTINIKEGIEVYDNNSPVTSLMLHDDMRGKPTILKHGSLSWYVIRRGDRFGIRLKNSESKLLKKFDDIDIFSIDAQWRIEAEFIEYNQAKEVEIPTAIGTKEKGTAYGNLKFKIDGTQFTLEPLGKVGSLFLVFGDKTNGEETYGAGRFLIVDKPDSTGKIFVDFNKAYNPPCVFTKYATCSLPTKENYLNINITAGEKNFHSDYH